MIVTLDGNKVEKAFEADTTLRAVIDAVRSEQPADCMVVGVALDGQTCTEAELSERLELPLQGVGQVDLETGNPKELGAQALRAIAEQVRKVGGQQEAIADKLNEGETSEAIGEIAEFVKAWQFVHQGIVQICQLTETDLTAMDFEGQPVSAYVDELLDRLVEIKGSLEAQDTVLLADLVRYETPGLCATWNDLLENLAQQLEGATRTAS
jgi:hypothetical protein